MLKLLYSLQLSTTKVKLMRASVVLLLKILQLKYFICSRRLKRLWTHLIYFSLDVSYLFAQSVHSLFKLQFFTLRRRFSSDLKVGFHCLNTDICFHLRCWMLSETKLADTKWSLPDVACTFTAGLEAQASYSGVSKPTADISVWAAEMNAEYPLHD